ncbi:MAG: YHYH protein [Herpetosiphonaceae bacterium]|nr:YHYH protein [Herpetosiphonaceae bacterium]
MAQFSRALAALALLALTLGLALSTAHTAATATPRLQGSTSTALQSSWQINLDNHTGAYSLSNGSAGTNLADVQMTQQDTSNVYIRATGIPSYAIGPFPQNPATPDEQNYRFRLPKNPTEELGTKRATGLGQIGVLVNGVPIYNALDAFSWSTSLEQDLPNNGAGQHGDGVWNRNAIIAEAISFDSCLGHPAPGQNAANGRYHNHQDPSCLRSMLGDDGAQHSPIIGWSFDGYPIYGPYGYSAATDTGSAVKRLSSSYRLRNITQRTTLPNGTVLQPSQYGPAISAQRPLGMYVEDFEYVGGLGDLDQYNGRMTVTSEYPEGIYAYHTTLDVNGAAAYPYFVGPQYFGVVATDNFGPGQVTIPADAQIIAPQRRYLPFTLR